MKLKPSENLLTKYHCLVKSDSVFSANARLLQSVWREQKGYPYENYGNQLPVEFAKRTRSNFLTEKIKELVQTELENIGDRVISEPRIWINLLSSQPLAFNLFGELKLDPDFKIINKVFKNLYPDRLDHITAVEFEYSPSRRNSKYTNDRSAFDVFIEYISKDKQKCFWGIEVKYAESMNDAPARLRPEYEDVANQMGIFKPESMDDLKFTSIQQLWRDHLLAGSMFIMNNDYDRGDFIVLFPEKNVQCQQVIDKYSETFNTDQNYFETLTLEKLIAELKLASNENWINEFYNRYLNFSQIEGL